MAAPNPSHRDRAPDRARTAIIVAVQTPDTSDEQTERSLEELENLLRGLGVEVLTRIVQKRPHRTGPTYVGEGKLRELAEHTGGPGEVARVPLPSAPSPSGRVDLVVVDDELTPGQQRNLERATGAEVLDRTAVILEVFRRRARTREAQLEVELARLEYELPRIRDDASLGDREGGGGRASRGHSNVELAKMRARDRIAALRRELDVLHAGAATRRQRRAERFRVALIGYTNAGKSSLMRLLTGSEVLVEDKLFATLGTTVRQLSPPATPPILITDTVGFINRLPHALVASFRSTLDEVNEASLLIYVVDASDPDRHRQLEVSRQVVRELGASEAPAWVVLNKVDCLSDEERKALAVEHPDAIPISALDPEHGRTLRQRLIEHFDRELVAARLRIPYAQQGVLAEVRDRVRIVSEEFGEVITIELRAPLDVLARLRKRLEAAG